MAKIMLVEDDKSLREIYGVRLLAEGYEIISAGDGEEALAMAVKEKPEIILSDVMMPKISGFDMLDILRATPETKNIKVIMMTALSSEDQRERGESLGADRYLVKSQVGIEDVVRTVHEVLGDAPISAAPAQRFGAPIPTTAEPVATAVVEPQPVASVAPVPQPPVTPVYAPDPVTQPVQPVVEPVPVVPVAPIPPVAPATPVATNIPVMDATPVQPPVPQPEQPALATSLTPSTAPMAPIPPVSTLPQPTAPFSTPAPASLGEKVINPITPVEPPKDINAMMSQELDGTAAFIQADQQTPATPPAPTPEVSAQMVQELHDGSETAPIDPPQF